MVKGGGGGGGSVSGDTVMEKLAVWLWAGDPLSVAFTVKFEVPLAVGVPEMTPPAESVRPAGRLPALSDQL